MSVFDHDRLLKNTIYQRLVDIVSTDHIHPKHDFRIGFIKELYFLLRVTPILSEKIQDEYLDLVEKWYNKNDGKKIEIGSQKLNNLYAAVAAHKDEANLRPKSGLACQQQFWDKEIPSFLRPYTAKQRVHELMPNGCKTEQGSTLAGTEDLYLRECTRPVK